MILKGSVIIRGLSVACILLAGSTFIQANSLGATVSVFFFMGVTFILYYYSKGIKNVDAKGIQLIIIIIIFIILFIIAVLTIDFNTYENFMYSIGKDPTLTGRTQIWSIAMESFPLHIFGGVGFRSYFQIDNINAIEIWETHHKEIGSAFGFHNTYIMGLIELGVLGFLIISFLFVRGLQGVARAVVLQMTKAQAFLICIFLIAFGKTFLEVVGFREFSFYTFMFCWPWIVLTKGTYFDQGFKN